MLRKTTANSRLPQWGLTWLIQVQCFYQSLGLVDSFCSPACWQAGKPARTQSPKALPVILKDDTTNKKSNGKTDRQNANASAKSKELHPHTHSHAMQDICFCPNATASRTIFYTFEN
jgi:hypothetical protein